jgi:pyridoxine 5'-phosphate synthase PdxJ
MQKLTEDLTLDFLEEFLEEVAKIDDRCHQITEQGGFIVAVSHLFVTVAKQAGDDTSVPMFVEIFSNTAKAFIDSAEVDVEVHAAQYSSDRQRKNWRSNSKLLNALLPLLASITAKHLYNEDFGNQVLLTLARQQGVIYTN